MLVDIISDLHIDFWINPSSGTRQKHIDKYINEVLKPLGGEVLIVAGDIGHKNFQMKEIMTALGEIYPHVIIVLGNHDLYIEANDPKKTRKDSVDRLLGIIKIVDGIDNLTMLRGQTVVINGIKFGGSMGWYNFSEFGNENLGDAEIQKMYLSRSSDPHYIRGMTSTNMYGDNRLNGREIFRTEIEKITEVLGQQPQVMITHIPPWISDENKKLTEFQEDLNYEYFDRPELLKQVPIWVHGHTHYPEDKVHNGCRVVSQPLGYKTDELRTSIKQIEI